jgi:SAM-dependent methyltransferase
MLQTIENNNTIEKYTYENYDYTSKSYDKTRKPAGTKYILEIIKKSHIPQEISILDCGCGSGNYVEALKKNFKTLVGIERSEGMLEFAKSKTFNDYNVNLIKGDLLEIPFKKEFEAAITTQVIHHLESKETFDEHTNLIKMMKQVYDSLKPGGVFIINTTTYEQYLNGYWYSEFIPEIMKKFQKILPSVESIKDCLSKVGFVNSDVIIPYDEILMDKDIYLNPIGPTLEYWRNGDSGFALISKDELETMTKRIHDLVDKEEMTEFLKKKEIDRLKFGQCLFVYSYKPLNE